MQRFGRDSKDAELGTSFCEFTVSFSSWLLIAACFLIVAGCGDSRSRRISAAAELRRFANEFRANSADLTPLNAIINVLEHGEHTFDRVYACGELQRLGSIATPAVPALVRAMDCGDPYLERESPRAIGAIGEGARDAVPALIENLRKEKDDAGWFSAEALGDIGLPAVVAIPELEAAAASNDPMLAESARLALVRLKSIQNESMAPVK